MKRILPVVAVVVMCDASLFLMPHPAGAQERPDKEYLETVIRDYLMENPEVIAEAMIKYQQNREKEVREKQKARLEEHRDYLESRERPEAGNPEGDVTLIEFFDYNCGYCKQALEDVLAVMDADENLRVVLIELPVLGPSSEMAAHWVLAARNQGKYFPYHVAVMEHKGPKNEETLAEIAEEVGLDVEQLREDAESEAVKDELRKNREIAFGIGLSGTPAFIVGDQISRGYVREDGLITQIGNARKNANQ